jgi:hypothetical protein
MPIISVLGSLWKENREFKTSLSYRVILSQKSKNKDKTGKKKMNSERFINFLEVL